MDTKIEFKERNPLSDDIASPNDTEFLRVKTNSDVMLLDDGCDVAIKTDFKSKNAFADLFSQKEGECFTKHLIKHIKSETVTCSHNYKIGTKTEIEEQTLVSDFGSHNEREFLPEDPLMKVKKYNDHQVDNKIEIKEEPWWLETETSSVYNDTKDGDFTPVESRRFSNIRCSNSCEMDTKIEIKEKDILSDNITSQNEAENITLKTNNDAALLVDDCDRAIKTDFKSEIPFSNSFLQKESECLTKHFLKPETVTHSNYKMGIKTEIEEQTLVSDFSSHKRVFLPEDPLLKVKKYTDYQVDNKIEIKEEPWWLEMEIPSVCDDIKNGDFAPVKSQRFCTKAVSDDSCGDSPLASTEPSGINISFIYGKDPECESQESDLTNVTPVIKHVHSEQCSKYHKGKIYVCDKSSTHPSSFKRHNLRHECKKPHKCKICEKSFTHLLYLKNHNLIHHSKKSHKCDICEKSFTHLFTLNRHNLVHKGKKPHKCDICEKSFTHLFTLKRHNLTHDRKNLHKCNICEMSFTHLFALRKHNLLHYGTKPHKCEICEKSFTHLSYLKNHNLIHYDKKPHKCDICEKRFTHLFTLKRHNLIHEGRKPHKCDTCEKSFTHLFALKRHSFIHEGKKPHKCAICEKSFTRMSHLKRHNLIHEGKKPHECEICEKSFIRLSDLKSHNMIHEGKKSHKCEICEKSFTHLSYLKKHKLIHEGTRPYKCEVCEKRFIRMSHLKSHNFIHRRKNPHRCKICEKSFTHLSYLKKHNLIHEGKKSH